MDALSARQHLDQTIQIFLAIEERLHQHAFVFAVHAHVVDIAGEPGMAVSRYSGITQVAAVRRRSCLGTCRLSEVSPVHESYCRQNNQQHPFHRFFPSIFELLPRRQMDSENTSIGALTGSRL
jgi:hypothetical protein